MSVGLCLFVYIDIATTEIIHITDNCSSFSRAKYFDVTRFPMSDVATPAIIIYIQWKLVSSIVPLLEFLVSSSGTRGPWTSVYLLVQNSLSSSNGVARTSGYIELETPPLDRNNSNLLELILIIRRFISKVQIYLDLL